MIGVAKRAELLDQATALAKEWRFSDLLMLLQPYQLHDILEEPSLGYLLGRAYTQRRHHREALSVAEALEPYCEQRHDFGLELKRQHLIACIHAELGNLAEADAIFARVLQNAALVEMPQLLATCTMNMGVISCSRGDFLEALIALQRALPAVQTIGEAITVVGCHHNLAVVYRELGMFDRAEQHFRIAAELVGPFEQRAEWETSAVETERAILCCVRGDILQAERLARRGLARCSVEVEPAAVADGLRVLGIVYRFKQDFPGALQHLSTALSYEARGPLELLRAEIYEELGWLAQEMGDYAAAVKHMEASRQWYEDAGANPKARRLAERMAEHVLDSPQVFDSASAS